jgi:hypothetical protein
MKSGGTPQGSDKALIMASERNHKKITHQMSMDDQTRRPWR